MSERGKTTPESEAIRPKRRRSLKSFAHRHQLGIASIGGDALTAWGYSIDGNPLLITAYGALSLGALAADVAITLENRWIWKDSTKVLGSKDASVFRASPNPAADLLEKHLGITYPEGKKPKKIEDNKTNRRIYQRRNFLLSPWPHEDEQPSSFNIVYNAFFTNTPESLFADLHENTHGLIDSTNNDFIAMNQQIRRAYLDMDANLKIGWYNIEKFVAYLFFTEGMCNWTTNTVQDELSDTEQTNLGRQGIYATSWTPRPRVPSDNDIFQISSDVDNLKMLFSNKRNNINRSKLSDRILKALSPNFYRIGEHAVSVAIDSLIAEGWNRREAVMALIQNPPTTLHDIFNPQDYVSTKILRPNV
jgi:hypothetical protein